MCGHFADPYLIYLFQASINQMMVSLYWRISIYCLIVILSLFYPSSVCIYSGIILCMGSANESLRYIVTSSFIGWVQPQNDLCTMYTLKCVSVSRFTM